MRALSLALCLFILWSFSCAQTQPQGLPVPANTPLDNSQILLQEQRCNVCHAALDEFYLRLGRAGDQTLIAERIDRMCENQAAADRPLCDDLLLQKKEIINRALEPSSNSQSICLHLNVCKPFGTGSGAGTPAPFMNKAEFLPASGMDGRPSMPISADNAGRLYAQRSPVFPGLVTQRERALDTREQTLHAQEIALKQRELLLEQREIELKQREDHFNRLVTSGGVLSTQNTVTSAQPGMAAPQRSLQSAEVRENPDPYDKFANELERGYEDGYLEAARAHSHPRGSELRGRSPHVVRDTE
eukprot:gnl/Spiro4/28601_TR14146_c0_g1_i1.p1 gnl/Spiro4/28601_TR14146_c0_g1~~gnl/Spiro4/28601_TR14146_c0_g1_i1.p1  ORF type:complete len:311 (+),score=47.19 gnl/Spiro4/28601_TR14146_c0_g1_i1:32-934(+)